MKLRGNILPTATVVSVLMLTAMAALVQLWELQMRGTGRLERQCQAQADVDSACLLYESSPATDSMTADTGFRLYDSLPRSHVRMHRENWGLYELLHTTTKDGAASSIRLLGADPQTGYTLYYTDRYAPVTLAGTTRLQGTLLLPHNGAAYGRIGSDSYEGERVPRSRIRQSGKSLPVPSGNIPQRIAEFLADNTHGTLFAVPDTLVCPFGNASLSELYLGNALVESCLLQGRILLLADELRIDSACRMDCVLVAARKITVGSGARISAQLFSRDTIVIEPHARLEYPSGLYAGRYIELGDRTSIDGYAIVRDTAPQGKFSTSYRQSRTARMRGLLWVEGTAQIQGIVAGTAHIDRTVWRSVQSLYRDMLYDVTLLENPCTAHPLWLAAPDTRRKEVRCVK